MRKISKDHRPAWEELELTTFLREYPRNKLGLDKCGQAAEKKIIPLAWQNARKVAAVPSLSAISTQVGI